MRHPADVSMTTDTPTIKSKPPFVLGLVGGVASGKSFAARLLAGMGGAVIRADELGHQVLARPLVARRLGQLFGPEILAADGSVDRQKIASYVFGNDSQALAARRQLEEVVHPLIHAAAVQELRRLQESAEPTKFVVIDAPLLLEAGWAPMCNAILYIDASDSVRRERASQRGWSMEQWRDREAAQWPLDEKRRAATHIVSSEPTELLSSRLRRIVEEIDGAGDVRV
jgi:dephospho-CoA kinase